MSRKSLAGVLVVAVVLAIGIVLWLGDDSRDEVNAFLRALMRAL